MNLLNTPGSITTSIMDKDFKEGKRGFEKVCADAQGYRSDLERCCSAYFLVRVFLICKRSTILVIFVMNSAPSSDVDAAKFLKAAKDAILLWENGSTVVWPSLRSAKAFLGRIEGLLRCRQSSLEPELQEEYEVPTERSTKLISHNRTKDSHRIV